MRVALGQRPFVLTGRLGRPARVQQEGSFLRGGHRVMGRGHVPSQGLPQRGHTGLLLPPLDRLHRGPAKLLQLLQGDVVIAGLRLVVRPELLL